MNSSELERLLRKKGVEIITNRGKGGHVLAIYKGRMTTIPRHGSRKEIANYVVQKILRQLGVD